MAVAPLRRRAGMNEIKNKERKMREELKQNAENQKPEEPISEDEHNKRLEMLKNLGILK